MPRTNYKTKTKEYYARLAPTYSDNVSKWRLDLIAQYNEPSKKVVDLGCGTGNYLLRLPNKVKAGIDISKESIAALKHRPQYNSGVQAIVGDLTKMSFKRSSFDLAYSFSTFYYVKEIDALVSEIARIMKPGSAGIFEFGNSHSLNALWDRLMFDVPQFHFTESRVRAALERNGLRVRRVLYRQPIPNFFGRFDKSFVRNRALQWFSFRMIFIVEKK